MVKPLKKSSRKNSSGAERSVLKILKEIKNPKPPLRVIGYFISDDGETKTEIGF